MTVVLALHIHDLISRVHLYIIVLWHEDKFRVLLTEGIRIHFPDQYFVRQVALYYSKSRRHRPIGLEVFTCHVCLQRC